MDIPVTEDIDGVASIGGMYYMAFMYIKNQAKIALLLRDISDFKIFGKPPNFDEKNRRLNFISNVVFIYLICTPTQYSIIKYTQKNICEARNEKIGYEDNCGFILPVWTPFSTKNVIVYWIYYICISVGAQILIKPSLLITFHAFEITQHLILKIEHLKQMLHDCFENKNDIICRKKLNKCISYHREIVR